MNNRSERYEVTTTVSCVPNADKLHQMCSGRYMKTESYPISNHESKIYGSFIPPHTMWHKRKNFFDIIRGLIKRLNNKENKKDD